MLAVVDRKQIMFYFLGINLLALVGLSLGLSLVFNNTFWGLGHWSGLGIVLLSIAGALFANWRLTGWLFEKFEANPALRSTNDLPGHEFTFTGHNLPLRQSSLAIRQLTKQATKIIADRSFDPNNSDIDNPERLQDFLDLGVQTLVEHMGCDYAAFYLRETNQVGQEVQYRRLAVSQPTNENPTNGRKIDLQALQLPNLIPAHQIDSITPGRLWPMSDLPESASGATTIAPEGYLHIIHSAFESSQLPTAAASITKDENDALSNIFHSLATIFGFAIHATENRLKIDLQMQKHPLNMPGVPPYPNAQDITDERRLAELESLWNISQSMAAEMDLGALYRVIHEQVNSIIGPIQSFAIVLYDQEYEMLSIPYMIEDNQTLDASPFPVGEGLSSIVIKNRQSLLLTHNSLEQSQALGAKFIGSPAKSWLGVPLIASGETVGLLIAQDTEQEGRFGLQDQHLLELVASQVAAVVRSARLYEQASLQAKRERISARVVSKVWGFSDVESILRTTLQELSDALGAEEGEIELEVSE